MRYRRVIAVLPALGALAACGQEAPPAPPPRDPVIAAVLNAPLMTDPDLVGQTQPGALFVLAGPASAPIPQIDRGDDEIAAARAEAAGLTGGAMAKAPPAIDAAGAMPGLTLGTTVSGVVAQLGAARACSTAPAYSAAWGARLPAAVPIYPRGHLRDAAGTDSPGCRLRAVSFLTPVAPGDVVDFYWARAAQAGLPASRTRAGAADRVVAARGAAGFSVVVGEEQGVTAVTLVTLGL